LGAEPPWLLLLLPLLLLLLLLLMSGMQLPHMQDETAALVEPGASTA